MYHYSVICRDSRLPVNVMSLEQEASINNIIAMEFEDAKEMFRIVRCGEPKQSEMDAASLALDGTVTLELALYPKSVSSGIGCGWRPAVFEYFPGRRILRGWSLRARCGHVVQHHDWETIALCKDCAEDLRRNLGL